MGTGGRPSRTSMLPTQRPANPGKGPGTSGRGSISDQFACPAGAAPADQAQWNSFRPVDLSRSADWASPRIAAVRDQVRESSIGVMGDAEQRSNPAPTGSFLAAGVLDRAQHVRDGSSGGPAISGTCSRRAFPAVNLTFARDISENSVLCCRHLSFHIHYTCRRPDTFRGYSHTKVMWLNEGPHTRQGDLSHVRPIQHRW